MPWTLDTCIFTSCDDLWCHFILTLVLLHQQSLYTPSNPGAWRRPASPLPAGAAWGEYCCILWRSPVPVVRSSSAHVNTLHLSLKPTPLTWRPSCEPTERDKCQKIPQTLQNSIKALVHTDASIFSKNLRVFLIFGSNNKTYNIMLLRKCIKSSKFHYKHATCFLSTKTRLYLQKQDYIIKCQKGTFFS